VTVELTVELVGLQLLAKICVCVAFGVLTFGGVVSGGGGGGVGFFVGLGVA
jgi:hypothetical protein